MKTLVQKFGGTSLATIPLIELAANRVVSAQQQGCGVVVVVSAMGKETDQLVALARSVNATLPKREYDMLLSSGEQKSMALLAMAIQQRGVDAISLTGWQAGINTTHQHAHAKIIDISTDVIQSHLQQGRVVIVAGFQGVTDHGEVTTLGRGGSDLSAVALAAALSASECQIFTDVDGVSVADPRIVSTATKVAAISYQEMAVFAAGGAGVLHARAVVLAEKLGVNLRVLSSFEPGRGTLVGSTLSADFIGVACRRRHVLAKINSDQDLTSAIRRASHEGLQIHFNQYEQGQYALLVPSEQAELLQPLFVGAAVAVELERDLSVVTLVSFHASLLQQADDAMRQAIQADSIELVLQQQAPHQLVFVVDDQVIETLVPRLVAMVSPA